MDMKELSKTILSFMLGFTHALEDVKYIPYARDFELLDNSPFKGLPLNRWVLSLLKTCFDGRKASDFCAQRGESR